MHSLQMKNISQSIKCIVKSSTCEKKNPKNEEIKPENVPQKKVWCDKAHPVASHLLLFPPLTLTEICIEKS